MPKFEAQVSVQITRQYEVVLQVEALDEDEARDKLEHEALGMKQRDLDRFVGGATNPSSYYDGEMTVLDHIGQVEEVPETEEETAHE